MTFGGDNFNDLPEIVPTREITTRIEKTFLVFSSVAVGLLLERASIARSLIRQTTGARRPGVKNKLH